ncbi:MAG: LysM peptidoglycan-binding domain-containing protein [Anaerolineales bacterium]|nr:LysM peptidoglycan-binding domain-containing protein [Anaerolineales bacterium]
MYVRTDMKSGAACYTVQANDNLSNISQRFFGDMSPNNVNRIYFSNLSTIGPNPNLIFPGQKLYIPD